MKALKLFSSKSTWPKIIFRNRSTEVVTGVNKTERSSASSIDSEDVKRHSKLNNRWWDRNGELYALHALNPLRIQFIRDGLANVGIEGDDECLPLRGLNVLEVGCGGGILSEPLARIGAKMTAIDPSVDLILTAKQHSLLDSSIIDRVHYEQTTIEEYSEKNIEAHDAVIASEVLEHVIDKRMFLKCCTKALKPGGSVFITTMNKTLPSWLGGILGAEYLLKLLPVGTHDWHKFISPAETQRLLETCGCRTKLIHGMFYNPLINEWFWTTSTVINYAIQAIKREES